HLAEARGHPRVRPGALRPAPRGGPLALTRGCDRPGWRALPRRGDPPEEAMGLVPGAGGEEEGARRPGGSAVAEGDAPEAVDRNGVAVGAEERSGEVPVAEDMLVGVDAPVAEVPNEQV